MPFDGTEKNTGRPAQPQGVTLRDVREVFPDALEGKGCTLVVVQGPPSYQGEISLRRLFKKPVLVVPGIENPSGSSRDIQVNKFLERAQNALNNHARITQLASSLIKIEGVVGISNQVVGSDTYGDLHVSMIVRLNESKALQDLKIIKEIKKVLEGSPLKEEIGEKNLWVHVSDFAGNNLIKVMGESPTPFHESLKLD